MVLGTEASPDVITPSDAKASSATKAGVPSADPHAKAKRVMMKVLRWSWEFVRPHFRHHKRRDFYQSHFLPTWALLAIRSLIFLYMLGITIYRPIDDSDDGEYLTYFTNINWIMLNVYFGLVVLYTIVVYVMKWLGLTKESDREDTSTKETDSNSAASTETDEEQGTVSEASADGQRTAAPGDGQWTRFVKFLRRHRLDLGKRITFDSVLWMFFTLVMVNAVYLDIIFWVAIYSTSDGDSNNESNETTITFYTINAHAINTAFVLFEIFFSKLRIYPFQILYVILFALAYMIFMWSWYGATDDWIYDQLSWGDGDHTLYYFGILGALVAVFAVLFLLTRIRDALARLGKRKLAKRRERKQAAKNASVQTDGATKDSKTHQSSAR